MKKRKTDGFWRLIYKREHGTKWETSSRHSDLDGAKLALQVLFKKARYPVVGIRPPGGGRVVCVRRVPWQQRLPFKGE
jgi:hypothetical protein